MEEPRCKICTLLGTSKCLLCVLGNTQEGIIWCANQLAEKIALIIQDKTEQEGKESEQLANVRNEVQELCIKYRKLQYDAEREVRGVQSYAKDLIDVQINYIKYHGLKSLSSPDNLKLMTSKMEDMTDAKDSLKKLGEEHLKIQDKVDNILWEASAAYNEDPELLTRMKDYYLRSITGAGSLIAAGSTLIGQAVVTDTGNYGISVACALVGTTLPFIYKGLSVDPAKKRKSRESFESIDIQMRQVRDHLTDLPNLLGDIEQNLKDAIKAVDTEIATNSLGWLKEIEKRGKKLDISCDKYFRKLEQEQILGRIN